MASIGEVVIGVDPHPGSHTLCAVDREGRERGRYVAGSELDAVEGVLRWAGQFPLRLWAVEGPGNAYARGMVAALRARGERVVSISPAMTAQYRSRRWRGKDDRIDAANAARAALANPDLPLHAPPPYERRLKELTRTYQRLSHQLAGSRMALRTLEEPEAREALQGVIAALEDAVARVKATVTAAVRPLAGDLLARRGVGPIVAGVILAESGAIGRFPTRDQFASFAGCAPIPWASGAHTAVRVNPGGTRRLNWAAHIVVLNRLRIDPKTKAYRDRKLAEGRTHREIIRALKTYVAREFYAVLTHHPSPAPA